MMPLSLSEYGSEVIIRRISGPPELRKHLEDLGFIAGSMVCVISSLEGNLIVKIKESRIAISKEMAMKIMV